MGLKKDIEIKYSPIKILSVVILTLILVLSFATLKASNTKKFDLFIEDWYGNKKITSEEFKDLITNSTMPPVRGQVISLPLYIKNNTSSNLDLRAITFQFEINGEALNISNSTFAIYPEDESFTVQTYPSSPMIMLAATRAVQILPNQDTLFASIILKADAFKEEDFTFAMSTFSGKPILETESNRYYDTDINLAPFIVGEPTFGDNVSISPKVGSKTIKDAWISPNVNNKYNVKKTISTNFSFADTEDLYIEPNADPSATVVVREKTTGTVLDPDGSTPEKYYIKNRNIHEYEVLVTGASGGEPVVYDIVLHVTSAVSGAYLDDVKFSNNATSSMSPNFSSKNFGPYTITLDHNNTVGNFQVSAQPGVTYTATLQGSPFTNFGTNRTYSHGEQIIFTVKDELTGVNTYTFNIAVKTASSEAGIDSISVAGETFNNPDQTITKTISEDMGIFNLVVTRKDLKSTVTIQEENGDIITRTSVRDIQIKKGTKKTFTIVVTSEDGQKENIYLVTVIRPQSSNTKVTNFTFHQGDNQVTLGAETTNFDITVPKGNFNISVATEDGASWDVLYNGSSIKSHGIDIETLPIETSFTVVVTALDGKTKETYIINTKKVSNEDKIENMFIQDYNQFDIIADLTDKYQYQIQKVGNKYVLNLDFKGTSKIFINVESSEYSVISFTQNSGFTSQKISDNKYVFAHTFTNSVAGSSFKLELKVTAENGKDFTVYDIEVNRAGADSSTNLHDLKINGETPENFVEGSSIGEFDVFIDPNRTTDVKFDLSVSAIASSKKSSIQINKDSKIAIPSKLHTNSGIITIDRNVKTVITVIVFAEIDTEQSPVRRTYTINVLYASDNVEVVDITLNHGVVLEVDPSNKFSYKATVDFSIREVYVNIITVDSGAYVLEDGRPADFNWKLESGWQQRIFTIVSESGQVSERYTIEITRSSGNPNKSLSSIIVETNAGYVTSLPVTSSKFDYSLLVDNFENNTENREFTVRVKVADTGGSLSETDYLLKEAELTKTILSGNTEIFLFKVYDQNGASVTYQIKITKASSVNTFEEVRVDNDDNVFTRDQFIDSGVGNISKLNEKIEFKYSVSEIQLTINLTDKYSEIVIIDGNLTSSSKGMFLWKLEAGRDNVLRFKILSQSGVDSKTFEIVVKRNAASKENGLDYLEVQGNDPIFNDAKYDKIKPNDTYQFLANRNLNHVTIILKLLKSHNKTVENFSQVEDDGTFLVFQKAFSFDELNKDIIINIKAEDVTVNTNRITVRIVRMSDINEFENIEVDGIESNFDFNDKFVTKATIDVRHDTTPFEIVFTKKDIYSQVVLNGSNYIEHKNKTYVIKVNPKELPEHNTTYKVKLRSEYDASVGNEIYSTEYEIVIRKAPVQKLGEIERLRFEINDEDILTGKFSKTVRTYPNNNVGYSDLTNSAQITAHTLASLNIKNIVGFSKGDSVLIDGKLFDVWTYSVDFGTNRDNNVEIKVISEDGNEHVYRVQVIRKNNNNTVIGAVVRGLVKDQTFDENDLSVPEVNLGSVPFSTTILNFQITRDDRYAEVFVNDIRMQAQNNNEEYDFPFELKDTGVNTIKVRLRSELGNNGRVVTFKVTRELANTDSKLKSLTVDHGNKNLMETIFQDKKYDYAFLVKENEQTTRIVDFFIEANPLATITFTFLNNLRISKGTMNDSINLRGDTEAANIIEIKVTSEAGNSSIYKLYLYYALNDFNMEDITLTELSGVTNDLTLTPADFINNRYSKTVPWDYNENNMSFVINKNDNNSRVVVTRNGVAVDKNNFELTEGSNRYEITITSHYGVVSEGLEKVDKISESSITYTITIIKEAANRNTNLEDLKVFDNATNEHIRFTDAFDKNDDDNRLYNINLTKEIKNIRVEYVTKPHQIVSNAADLVSIDLEYDNAGVINTTILVTVEANGESKSYRIRITKGLNSSSSTEINDIFDLKGKDQTYSYNMNLHTKNNPLIVESIDDYLGIYNMLTEDKQRLEPNIITNLVAGIVNEIKVTVIAEDNTRKEYTLFIQRKELSDDNLLKSLRIEYNADSYYYKTGTDIEDEIFITLPRHARAVNITAIKNHLNAKKPVISNTNLIEGSLNIITITVIAENGDVKVYKINIDLRDTNADIELEFKLNEKVLPVTKTPDTNGFKYDLGKIPYTKNMLDVIIKSKTSNYVLVTGDIGNLDLEVGVNTFTIISTSEDGKTEIVHTIIIEILQGDTNNLLDKLEVKSGITVLEFDGGAFDPAKNTYQIKLAINSKVTVVNIDAVAQSSTAKLSGYNKQEVLEEIEGVIFKQIRIVVTSEIGEENIYVVNIVKAQAGGADDDNSVKEIYIRGLITNTRYSYTDGDTTPIVIDKNDNLVEVIVITNSPNAIVESKTGSLVFTLTAGALTNANITVKSQDLSSSQNYLIPMMRESFNDEALLTELQINGKNISLLDNVFAYNTTIDKDVNELVFTWLLSDGAKTNHEMPLIIEFASGMDRTVTIALTSEDGKTTNVYTIIIVKDNYEIEFDSIMINDDERLQDFINGKLILNDRLYKDSKITIDAITLDNDAKVTIDVNGKKLTGIQELHHDIELQVGDNTIIIYAEGKNGSMSTVYTVEVLRGEPNSVNSLLDLKLEDPNNLGFNYIENFSPNSMNYKVTLDATKENIPKVKITVKTENEYQVVKGDGDVSLKTFSNSGLVSEILEVIVTSEDGNSRTYIIEIARHFDKNTDVSVTEFQMLGSDRINYLGTSANAENRFVTGSYNYVIRVPFATSYVMITARNTNGAEIVYLGNSDQTGSFTLKTEETTIEFEMKSQDGTVTSDKYVITVIKEEGSNNNELESITVDGLLIDGFKPGTYLYNVYIDSGKKDVVLGAKASDPLATIAGLGKKVITESQSTVLTITVTAENGDEQDYIVIVHSVNNDNNIYDIKVDGFDISPQFNENIYSYELEVPYNVEVIEIKVDAHEKSTINNIGFHRLLDGLNSFDIFATSEKGERGKIYTLKITRTPISKDNALKDLTVYDHISGKILAYNPVFNPETLNYVIVLEKGSPTTSINIHANTRNEFANVGGTGFHNLENKLEGTEFGNIFNLVVRAQNGDTRTYTLVVYKGVEGLDSNNELKNIEILGSDGVLYLGLGDNAKTVFNPRTRSYIINVPYNVTSINAKAFAVSDKAYITIRNNEHQVFDGVDELTFNILITSATGIEGDVYEVIVKRTKPTGSNTLGSITVDGKEVADFEPNKTDYKINIPYNENLKTVKIDAILPLGSNAIISGDVGNMALEKGENTYYITLLSDDNNPKTYKITIYFYSNNALLENITILGSDGFDYNLDFVPETFSYEISLNKGETEISIKATAQEENAKIVGATTKILNGQTVQSFEVHVTAQDETTINTYVINTKDSTFRSNNTKLQSLVIDGFTLRFSKDQRNYSIATKESITELVIDAVPEDQNAIVEIIGADDIKDGRNTILIKVTAEDGTHDFYNIEFTREPTQDVLFLMLLILTFFLWLITIVVILFKRQRDKDDNFDTDVIY